jgi:hypothetical protein
VHGNICDSRCFLKCFPVCPPVEVNIVAETKFASREAKMFQSYQIQKPQTVNNIVTNTRRRATKFILSLPYRIQIYLTRRDCSLLTFSQSATGKNTSRILVYIKSSLFKYYLDLLEHIYNPDNPRTFKSVCAKCHSTRPLASLSVRTCC